MMKASKKGPGKRSKVGHQRSNGRWEARFRPQSRHPLDVDPVTMAAFKGYEDGQYKYEFLDYFDTAKEKNQWLCAVKTDFKRRKMQSDPSNKKDNGVVKTSEKLSPSSITKTSENAGFQEIKQKSGPFQHQLIHTEEDGSETDAGLDFNKHAWKSSFVPVDARASLHDHQASAQIQNLEPSKFIGIAAYSPLYETKKYSSPVGSTTIEHNTLMAGALRRPFETCKPSASVKLPDLQQLAQTTDAPEAAVASSSIREEEFGHDLFLRQRMQNEPFHAPDLAPESSEEVDNTIMENKVLGSMSHE